MKVNDVINLCFIVQVSTTLSMGLTDARFIA